MPFTHSAIEQAYRTMRVKHAYKQFLVRNYQSPPVERKHLPRFRKSGFYDMAKKGSIYLR